MHMYNFLCSDSLLYFFLFLSTLHSVYTRDCSCKHVACVEQRKYTGLDGVLGLGHASMWHVWSTGNVLVWVEFWEQDMQACGRYGAQES